MVYVCGLLIILRIAMEGVGGSQIKSKAGPLGLLLPKAGSGGRLWLGQGESSDISTIWKRYLNWKNMLF